MAIIPIGPRGGEERSGIKRFQLKVFWNVRRGKIVLGLIWMLEDGSRINFEWVKPFYQDLDGVQLETDFMMFTSWSKSW